MLLPSAMPKTAGEINPPRGAGGIFASSEGPIYLLSSNFGPAPYLRGMNYVLALFLPPLSILLLGRVFLSIVVFLIWVPAILFTGGLTHPMFVLLAWILIYQTHEDRRYKRDAR
jgi:hypothetical protein